MPPGIDKYYNPSNKVVHDGDTANADDLNAINNAVDASFEEVADDIDALSNDAALYADQARKWAELNDYSPTALGQPDPGTYPGRYSAWAYAQETMDWASADDGDFLAGDTIRLANGSTTLFPSAHTSALAAQAAALQAIGQNTISADGTYMQINETPNVGGGINFEIAFIADPVVQTGDTGSADIPVGDSSERDGTPVQGYFRFNTDLNSFEGYDGTAWGSVGGGAKGAAQNPVFFENDIHVTGNYEITTDKNAMSAGPIVIDAGVLVTIPAGSTWTVV